MHISSFSLAEYFDNKQQDHSHIELSCVFPIYFNQTQPTALFQLLEKYAAYPADILDVMQFVIVDDGSPITFELTERYNLNILLLRIEADIPWNQGGARNLGAVYARSDKVLLGDMDHYYPAETLRKILTIGPLGRKVYRMTRLTAQGEKIYRHCNTFLMSRGRYLQYFGVDEELCGHYGFEDTLLTRWQKYHGTRYLYLSSCYPIIEMPYDRASSYHSLVRDLEYNAKVSERKIKELKKYGPNGCHSRQFLNFPWTIVKDMQRKPSAGFKKKTNKLWAYTWWLRWLFG